MHIMAFKYKCTALSFGSLSWWECNLWLFSQIVSCVACSYEHERFSPKCSVNSLKFSSFLLTSKNAWMDTMATKCSHFIDLPILNESLSKHVTDRTLDSRQSRTIWWPSISGQCPFQSYPNTRPFARQSPSTSPQTFA